MNAEELRTKALEYWDIAIGYLSHPELLFQVGLVVLLFLPAWFLSTRIEPLLEEQARKIKGMPGTLRIIVAFLRRMEWFFFVILLGIAYVVTTAAQWPENNYLIYSAMLLAGAWLLERVVRCMGRSSILLKPHSALLVDSKLLAKFFFEGVDDFTVTLAVDCHCLATRVLKPVRSDETMSGVECDPCSHFGALQMFLTHLFRRILAQENVVMIVNCPIEVIKSLVTEPDVVQPAR